MSALLPQFVQAQWLWLLLALPLIVWLRWRARIAEAPLKRLAGTTLRCASVTLLVLALAGPLQNNHSPRSDIVFVLDVSESIDQRTVQSALDFINHVQTAKQDSVRTALVVFGAEPAVERLLSESDDLFAQLSVESSRGGSDIASAIEVAVGLFQSPGQRRLVVLSDGQENIGDARLAAAAASAVGVRIDSMALERDEAADEILLHSITAPGEVTEKEPFRVDVLLASQAPAEAHLLITRNGSPLEEAHMQLQRGLNSYSFVDQLDSPGLYAYEAIVNSGQDQVQQNNRYQSFVRVGGASRILHAVGEPGTGHYVSSALRAQGLLVDELAGSAIPASMHELLEYDLLILNNVPALDMSQAKMQMIEEYVRDAGGGLLMLGGDKSYGAGGYLATPIERALPVTMDIKTDVEVPSLAVTVIIDKSGSMGADQKLAVAKDAAYAAVQILKPIDTVGVLAFAGEAQWSVPPRKVGDRKEIVERLRLVDSGGNTDLHAALLQAHQVMREQQTRAKHVILLSDGLSDTSAQAFDLVSLFEEDAITLSAVAFGADANQELMRGLAARGSGRYYFTKDAGNVPRIFTSETLIIARNLFVEKDLDPQLHYAGELLEGLEAQGFPPISGYQRVFAKPAAQLLLAADQHDPLLVSWRYGLGKSVAFASDLSGRWTGQWLRWSQFSRFIAQTARWTRRQRTSERLLPQFRRSGQEFELIVDVLDRDDRFINGLRFQAGVLDSAQYSAQGSGAHAGDIAMQQISPGRYRGKFSAPAEGLYYINLSASTEQMQIAAQTFGLAVPYSAEYLELGVNQPLLSAIAEQGGGRVLKMNSTSLPYLLAQQSAQTGYRAPLWWPALLFALLLLILEIALRRLALPQSWQPRLPRWLQAGTESDAAQAQYDALVEQISAARQAHLDALQQGPRPDPGDPAARARLYIAGSQRGRG